ncbi:MAG: hypothetical protein C4576_19780 [Desulfobacteraceae bacterium]|nr:MAG: hypothetical protein C4576_19780 [Desulfobacteraceae bacterium]
MKRDIQADRKKILAAIRAEQEYIDATETAEKLQEKSWAILMPMIKHKSVERLGELKKVFRELKPSFKKSEAYRIVLGFFEDEIIERAAGRGNFQRAKS